MTDRPDYTAPSPADGPTARGMPPAQREPDVPPTSSAPDADAGEDDGTETVAPREPATVPARPGPSGLRTSRPGRTRMSGTWVGLILGAVVLVFLLVFILQNPAPARVSFLAWQATLPLGIWLLFAAIAGLLLLAVPGLGRLIQWRRASGPSRSGRRGR